MLKKLIVNEIEKEVKLDMKHMGEYVCATGNETCAITLHRSINGEHCFTLNNKCYTAFTSLDADGSIWVTLAGKNFLFKDASKSYVGAEDAMSGDSVSVQFPGKVVKIFVSVGDTVKKGDPLIIVEAMKLENTLVSPRDGVVEKSAFTVGQQVEANVALVSLVVEEKAEE